MTQRAPLFGRTLTAWSLTALAVGLAGGILLHGTGGVVDLLGSIVAPVGQLWVRALQMVVLPLVIVHLLVAITGAGEGGAGSLGRLGGKALGLFVTMLAGAAAFTVLIAPPAIALYPVSPEASAALRSGASVPASALEAAREGPAGAGDWLVGLLPANLFEALRQGEILPVLVFSVLLGLAVLQLPEGTRRPLVTLFRGLSEALMVIVHWILVVTPIGVFALAFELALGAGFGAAGFLVAFVVLVSGALVLFTLALYPVTVLTAGVGLRDFIRATLPAQLVAVSTRSSLAALPALIEGGRDQLRLPASATGFVLPLSTSIFKVNRTVSSTTKLLFLAHVFGVSISAGTIVTFVATVILLSFTAVGVPGGGASFRTLPAYLAAGLPIEGVVIVEAVDVIPDIFKTLTNVTGDMSAASILSRRERARAVAPAGVASGVPHPPGPAEPATS